MLEGAGRVAQDRALLLGRLVHVGRVAQRGAGRHGAGVGGPTVVDGAEVGRVDAVTFRNDLGSFELGQIDMGFQASIPIEAYRAALVRTWEVRSTQVM